MLLVLIKLLKEVQKSLIKKVVFLYISLYNFVKAQLLLLKLLHCLQKFHHQKLLLLQIHCFFEVLFL